MNQKNQLFESIVSDLFNLEEGDILSTSNLVDKIKSLSKVFAKNSNELEIVGILCEQLEKSMKKDTLKDIIGMLTDGIDLLQKVSNNDESIDQEYLSKKINQWIKDHSDRNSGSVIIQEESMDNDCNDDEKDQQDLININMDALNVFLAEGEERMLNAQEIILELEKDFTDVEKINQLFRIFHTIKGECGFLKIASLGELAHNIETLLDLMRERKITLNSSIIDQLLTGIDLTKAILEQLKKGQGIIFNEVHTEKFIESILSIVSQEHISIGDVLVKKNKITEQEKNQILNEQKLKIFNKKFGEIAIEKELVSENDIQESLKDQKKIKNEEDQIIKNDPIIKVKASKINYLVDMIGELIIAQGQISDTSLIYSQINKITRGLQYAAMQLRTEKMKTLFNNMKRVIRDVSKSLHKTVLIDMKGEELEVDRNLIEKLEEPLMHLIRNSIHHGIESKEERLAANKPIEGKIAINAERKGNKIVISVQDDGQGLNKEKILKKALEKKLIRDENVQNMSDNEIYNLIFIQGFSTADELSYVSGRGVGMDIVRSATIAMRGKLDIQTQKGSFTKFSLIFPLNTAIIDGMIVKVCGNYLVIPVTSIILSVKIKKSDIFPINQKVKTLHYNDEVYPIIDLKKFLELGDSDISEAIGVIVENSDKKKFVFTVDEIIAKKDIVIKSLGKKLGKLKGVSSGTVLNGGRVGLVLDVEQIIEQNIILEN